MQQEGESMKRVKAVVLSACVAASMWIVVAPSPASACDRYPCHAACHVNEPYVTEDGNIVMPSRLIDCYY
jgi:hypothetical protein